MPPKRLDEGLSRKTNVRTERRRILIVTEGTVTEPSYFRRLATHLRETGVLVRGADVIGVGMDPLRIVQRAEQEAGDSVGRRDGFDSVWCVFDVDAHRRLHKAVAEAGRLGYRLAISNPCIEIWLLWHYADCVEPMTARSLQAALARHGMSGKRLPHSFPYQNLDHAIGRAESAVADIPDNPGSRVWSLADYLRTDD
ncbi:RloB domain-containing protein [Pseudonocardiaceae bacterium YIM PH 21723]|nr:RloB domain-containing protein [Pseudonocardiaceae bacterium YIM PH 21723]